MLIRKRLPVEAAIALTVFTVSTNFIFHNLGSMKEPQSAIELSLFFKNIVVVGTLIFVAGVDLEQKNKA